jgi:hypothetical protein
MRQRLRWQPRQWRRAAGWRGGGAAEETAATVVAECSGCHPKLSMTIAAPAKAGAIPAWTMTAEAAAEAAVVARRIATPPPPTGGGLRSYRIAPTLAVECSTLYTAATLTAVHILPTIGRTMMRAAGGAIPATTAATATTWPGTASAT